MKISTAMNGDYGELLLNGALGTFDGETSATDLDQALHSLAGAKRIRAFINSGGGDAFEGIAMYNRIRRDGRWVEVVVDGLAASAASVVAMAADNIVVPTGGFLMVHECWAKPLAMPADTSTRPKS